MGFRLNCRCYHNDKINYYGTKLYGYYKGIDNLPSIKYLESIGLRRTYEIPPDESIESYFDYMNCTPDFIMTAAEFKIFMLLYCYDWNNTVDKTQYQNKGFENFLEDKDIKALIDSNDWIVINWE